MHALLVRVYHIVQKRTLFSLSLCHPPAFKTLDTLVKKDTSYHFCMPQQGDRNVSGKVNVMGGGGGLYRLTTINYWQV